MSKREFTSKLESHVRIQLPHNRHGGCVLQPKSIVLNIQSPIEHLNRLEKHIETHFYNVKCPSNVPAKSIEKEVSRKVSSEIASELSSVVTIIPTPSAGNLYFSHAARSFPSM